MHFGPVFGKVPPERGGRESKNTHRGIMSGVRGASRGGYGVLCERQPPVHTPNVNVGCSSGRPATYVAVRLDVVTVQYGHAEYRRLLVYAAGVPEAASEPAVEVLLLVSVAYEVPNVDVACGWT